MALPLPPLPSTPGDETWKPAGEEVVKVLADEHRRIAELCSRLTDESVPEDERARVAEVVIATVTRHLSAEEQYLYPAVAGTLDDGRTLAEREIAEDREILLTLRSLSSIKPADPDFDRIAGTICGQLARHAETATGRLLPGLADAASEADLIRLGNRVQIAEEAAPTRPHPGTPATPPWNKVVDPAVAVVDKVLDAVTGRPTYPSDLKDS
ncbi:hemerythrin domain-containing protein [Catenuloplanes atrovinosus]|uniref:Component of type VI protein secretion system n=1 Tax=Catenuloplanes atrovinosus TaxID=137266 RepID=A0AAE3YIL4_9ACTN|nr:hemerythrin domain-containing protein [Catenuloplanes atrovinosus]MDR7274538.1 putative component of type VI protein secretion system [Catenuloplanes atrovinosus]